MPQTATKKTLREIHEEVKQLSADKCTAVLNVLGVKTTQTFYDLFTQRRKVNEAEKAAIAKIYGKTVDEIDWLDEPTLIA